MNLDIQLFNLLTEYTLPEVQKSLDSAIVQHVVRTSISEFAKKHGVQYRTIENKVSVPRQYKTLKETPKEVQKEICNMWLHLGTAISEAARETSVEYHVALKIINNCRDGNLL